MLKGLEVETEAGAGSGDGLAVLKNTGAGQGVGTEAVSDADLGHVPKVAGPREKGVSGGDLLQDLGKLVGTRPVYLLVGLGVEVEVLVGKTVRRGIWVNSSPNLKAGRPCTSESPNQLKNQKSLQ